jgi:hypothetical protein
MDNYGFISSGSWAVSQGGANSWSFPQSKGAYINTAASGELSISMERSCSVPMCKSAVSKKQELVFSKGGLGLCRKHLRDFNRMKKNNDLAGLARFWNNGIDGMFYIKEDSLSPYKFMDFPDIQTALGAMNLGDHLDLNSHLLYGLRNNRYVEVWVGRAFAAEHLVEKMERCGLGGLVELLARHYEWSRIMESAYGVYYRRQEEHGR